MNTWNKWWSKYAGHPDLKLLSMTKVQFNFYSRRFWIEARKVNGGIFPAKTLYQLACGLNRSFRKINHKFNYFSDEEFHESREVLDSKMKLLTQEGYGFSSPAEEFTPDDDF